MGNQLHVTLGSGDTHQVDLQPASTLIVRTRKVNDIGVVEDVESAWSDVVDVSVVEVEEPENPGRVIVQESPYLGTPESAAQAAAMLPVGDAAQLLEQAADKFGADHPVIVDAQATVADKLRASGAPAAADETIAEEPSATDDTAAADDISSTDPIATDPATDDAVSAPATDAADDDPPAA